MTDPLDISADRSQAERDRLVANRVIYRGESRHDCVECDEPIPQARREAIPGCTRCTSCQQDHDCRTRR